MTPSQGARKHCSTLPVIHLAKRPVSCLTSTTPAEPAEPADLSAMDLDTGEGVTNMGSSHIPSNLALAVALALDDINVFFKNLI